MILNVTEVLTVNLSKQKLGLLLKLCHQFLITACACVEFFSASKMHFCSHLSR